MLDLLYRKENVSLLEQIITKKINDIIGMDVVNQDKKYFYEVLSQVIKEVASKELNNTKHRDVQSAILYVNNIIIAETVQFFLSQVDDSMQTLEPEEDDGLSLLKTPSMNQSTTIEIPKKPVETKVDYTLDAPNCLYLSPRYEHNDVQLTGITNISVEYVMIDNMGFNVTEFKNTLVINDREIIITPGDYSFQELCDEINKNKEISLCFDKISNKFLFDAIEEVKLDFTCKNSACSILGFDRKVYKIEQGSEVKAEKYNALTDNPYVDLCVSFLYENETKDVITLRIPMDNKKGSTKYFYPPQHKFTKKVHTLDKMLVSFTDSDKNEYYLRDRNFYINLNIEMATIPSN